MKKLALTAFLLAGLTSTGASAYDNLAFAGGEISGNNGAYGGVGVIGAIPGTNSTFGNGWVYRVVGEGLSYSYDKNGGDIDATSFGGEVALGYQRSFESKSWLAAYAGPTYHNTDLSPNDPGNDNRGGKFGFKVQAEGEKYLASNFKLGGSASYTFNYDSHWVRGRVLYAPTGTFFVGPEVVYQGDDSYKSWSAGAVINTILINESTDLGFKGGYKKTENQSGGGYGGVEVSHSF